MRCITGSVQWCPVRTAIPKVSRYIPTSSAFNPSITKKQQPIYLSKFQSDEVHLFWKFKRRIFHQPQFMIQSGRPVHGLQNNLLLLPMQSHPRYSGVPASNLYGTSLNVVFAWNLQNVSSLLHPDTVASSRDGQAFHTTHQLLLALTFCVRRMQENHNPDPTSIGSWTTACAASTRTGIPFDEPGGSYPSPD